MTEFNFDTIRERDMDIVIMREFYTNKLFADLFLKQVGISECDIKSIDHSVLDTALGESDIEVILESKGKKIALLIENKINAEQQPKQYERYVERGEKKKSEGTVDDFYVFMAAPTSYFSSQNQYRYRVSYEEMLSVMDDDFSLLSIKKALEKKEAYAPTPDEMVSAFWEALYKYAKDNFEQVWKLMPTKAEKKRGTNAQWPGFRTAVSETEIQWKADRGAVDLQLNNMADYKSLIEDLLEETHGEHTYQVVKTGKSSSIRKEVPQVDFHHPFDAQREKVAEALKAVREMYELAQTIGEDVMRIRKNEPRPLLKQAIAIATEAHKGQKDKVGADYIGHPLRVAARLQDEKEKIDKAIELESKRDNPDAFLMILDNYLDKGSRAYKRIAAIVSSMYGSTYKKNDTKSQQEQHIMSSYQDRTLTDHETPNVSQNPTYVHSSKFITDSNCFNFLKSLVPQNLQNKFENDLQWFQDEYAKGDDSQYYKHARRENNETIGSFIRYISKKEYAKQINIVEIEKILRKIYV